MKHIFILKPDTSKSLVNCIVSLMQGKRYELRYTKDLDDIDDGDDPEDELADGIEGQLTEFSDADLDEENQD